jgi:phosphopentomutase
MSMTIKIIGPDIDGYSMEVDGTTLMECLSEKEVREMTIGEIADLFKEIYG